MALSARRNAKKCQKQNKPNVGFQIQTQIRLDLDLTRHSWVGWLRGDAAHVARCADLQVAIVTPAGAPGVLHEVVAAGGVKACSQPPWSRLVPQPELSTPLE